MPTLVLALLRKALNWALKHPVECLIVIVCLVAGYACHERAGRIKAEANGKRLENNIAAWQDTTKFVRGQNERLVITLNSTSELAANYKAKFDSVARTANHGRPTAGVVVTRPADSVTVSQPVAARTDTASIDTLGVHAAVQMTDSATKWHIRRDPSTITVLFTEQNGKPYVIARSDDGARLEVESPFVRTPAAEPSHGIRLPLWAVAIVGVAGFTVGVASSK